MSREGALSSSAQQSLDRTAGSTPYRLSLRANFSWAFVGNVAYAASQWGMLVALAKLGSPEMVGCFALGLALAAPIMGFANLQLRLIEATDARGDFLFGDYLGLQTASSAAGVLLTAAVALSQGYPRETVLVILLLALAKGLENISDVFFGMFQQNDRMDRIAKSLVIKGPLSLVALGTTVWLTNSVLWGVVGLVTSWLLVLLLYDLRSRVLILRLRGQGAGSQSYWPRPRFGGRALAKLAWLALPLGFSTMLMALTTSIPRYFVEQQLGEGELGVFAALAYFHRAGTTIVNALGQSASPRLSRHYSTGDMAGFRVLLARMIGIAIVLGAAAVLVARLGGRELLSLLYGPAYARQGVFVRLMAASGLSYVASFLLYGLTAARRLSAQSVLYVFMTGVLALACSVLVPIHGLEGAGNALLIARGVQIVGALVAVSSVLSMRPGPQETDVADPVLTSRR